MSKSVANATQWRNRIVGHTEEAPAQLLANPLNFRRHPGAQRDALRGSIGELGWIKAVLVNRTTGHIIDGHARCEEATTAGATVPVDWVEMTEAEERLALAVLDPITEMATRDSEALTALLADVSTKDAGLQSLLDHLAATENVPEEHWQGMPEYEQDDLDAFRSIKINFADQAAVNNFAMLVRQSITEKTRFIWYPEAPILKTADKRYVDES